MTTEEKVKKVLMGYFGLRAAPKDSDFIVDSLGADSLDEIEIIMALEEEFDLEIPDNEAEKIKTVGDAVRYVENSLKDK
ncbi:MAG: acyl carrier protein [Gammaproteobacteria bacterium]|nr:acyl carrier protein [Gammaproteobacteria bacterium]